MNQACPSCGEVGAPGAIWCEACGADFAGEHEAVEGPPCVDCGADFSEISDGYCSDCGRKQPAPRDHMVESLDQLVAVTDRGKRHHHNEDHYAIGRVDDTSVIVVCDGVSTTDFPEEASLLAAVAARDVLVSALEAGATDIAAVVVEAVAAAQVEAAGVEEKPQGQGPASTTIVATVLRPDSADSSIVRSTTAWLGDSRAYWVQPNADSEAAPFVTVTQLMTDDVIGPSISRWLGADAGDTNPSVQEFEHDVGGRLLSCSDGLWKYVPDSSELAALIDRLDPESETSMDLAEALVAFANEQGGHDNTTVVIATT